MYPILSHIVDKNNNYNDKYEYKVRITKNATHFTY